MISKILVPTDGSKTAQKAAIYAVGLAKQLHASIVVMSVMDERFLTSRTVTVRRSQPGVAESLDDYLRETAGAFAGEVERLCKKTRIKSKTVIRPGHPVEEIVKEAAKSKVDLIVMGSHGQSSLEAAALGSVTYGVMHKDTKIPVLVVRK
jgi:nucleotide-binding universal stress UspA family protein